MSDKPTILEVVDKLATLGSADQIAAFFEEQGVQGWPNEAASCPVANYVSRETSLRVLAGESCVVENSGPIGAARQKVDFWIRKGDMDLHPEKLEKYRGVSEFVRAFDEGRYPNLVQGDGDV